MRVDADDGAVLTPPSPAGLPGHDRGALATSGDASAEPILDVDREAISSCLDRLSDAPAVSDLVSRGLAAGAEVSWDARTLGNGFAGIAYAHLLLQRGSTGVGSAAHELLSAAIGATKVHPLTSLGLYDGASGVDRVLAAFAARDDRYAAASVRFRDRVRASMLEDVRRRPPSHESDIDVISGRAGWLLHLSSAAAGGDSSAREVARAVSSDLGAIVRRSSRPIHVLHARTPTRQDTPGEVVDRLGVAHGAAGILLALSTSVIAEVGDGAVREQVARLTHEVFAVRVGEGLSADETARPGTPAWCTGDAGVDLAVIRAGEALCDGRLRDHAAASLLARLERLAPAAPDTANDASLCHGSAGLLALARAARPYVHPDRWAALHLTLTRRLLRSFDPDAPLGFSLASHDDPAFLMGAAGALVMLGGDDRARGACTELLTGGAVHG